MPSVTTFNCFGLTLQRITKIFRHAAGLRRLICAPSYRPVTQRLSYWNKPLVRQTEKKQTCAVFGQHDIKFNQSDKKGSILKHQQKKN